MLLQKFSFTENQDVMTLVHPVHGFLFEAKGICEILEYPKDTTESVLRKLDDDEKVLLKREEYDHPMNQESEKLKESVGKYSSNLKPGAVKKWFVNEPGLFSLIMGSKKPEAHVFKRWITHEVIPSLRRTGYYTIPNATAGNAIPEISPLERMALNLKISQMELTQKELAACVEIFAKFTNIEGNQAKLAANRLFKQMYQVDIIKTAEVDLPSKVQARCWYPTELGRPYSISAIRMNGILELAGLQTASYHTSASGRKYKVWSATEEGKAFSEYVDIGKEHSNGTPVQSLKWYETVLGHEKVKQAIAIANAPANPTRTIIIGTNATLSPSERLRNLQENQDEDLF